MNPPVRASLHTKRSLVRTQQIPAIPQATFAGDVRAGLTKPGQKELLSKYLYNDIGSALFEVICLLPEYGLTRADARLLRKHADDIVSRIPCKPVVAELGSGSGQKTRWILESLSKRQAVTYYPIDISGAALARSRQELGEIPFVNLVGFEREYLDGMLEVAARRKEDECLLVLFLGSTIGNFDRDAGERFLRELRVMLNPGDYLLLGTDLVKPVPQLLVAYDDPLGVTAVFNLNLLERINVELGGDFDLRRFRHVARYDEAERRIEMHLRSEAEQSVHIQRAGITVDFHAGETIWTESSHKYSLPEIETMAHRTGFHCESQWVDEDWPFAQNLFLAH